MSTIPHRHMSNSTILALPPTVSKPLCLISPSDTHLWTCLFWLVLVIIHSPLLLPLPAPPSFNWCHHLHSSHQKFSLPSFKSSFCHRILLDTSLHPARVDHLFYCTARWLTRPPLKYQLFAVSPSCLSPSHSHTKMLSYFPLSFTFYPEQVPTSGLFHLLLTLFDPFNRIFICLFYFICCPSVKPEYWNDFEKIFLTHMDKTDMNWGVKGCFNKLMKNK